VQVAKNVEFRANLSFPKPIVFCADERYRPHQGRLLWVGRGGSASPHTLLIKIFFNR
jgi:hypothetical protein